jgi:ribonuclease G
MKEALRRDRSKTNILQMSELGLMQMTRKRTRESIKRVLCEPCCYCEGEGTLKSRRTMCYEILRDLRRERRDLFGRKVMVLTHPEVAGLFCDEEREPLERLERELQANIVVKGQPDLHMEQYEISPLVL